MLYDTIYFRLICFMDIVLHFFFCLAPNTYTCYAAEARIDDAFYDR